MTQTERRKYLIKFLLSERRETTDIPQDEYNQKRLLRSLFNIRMPRAVSDEFLQIQDKYLQEENRRKGITDIVFTEAGWNALLRTHGIVRQRYRDSFSGAAERAAGPSLIKVQTFHRRSSFFCSDYKHL